MRKKDTLFDPGEYKFKSLSGRGIALTLRNREITRADNRDDLRVIMDELIATNRACCSLVATHPWGRN
jgi:hypothetical protein